MQFVGCIDGSLRKRDLKRRLTSPPAPILQKLPVGGARRLKDRREEAIVRQFEQQVHSELQNQHQQCRERFLNRWHHIRNLYAVISEVMTARTEASSKLKSKLPLPAAGAPSVSKGPTEPLTPAPLHKLTSMAWLIDVAREFRQGVATHLVTIPKTEIVFGTALHLSLTSARTSQIASCLRGVFQAFQQQPESCTIDYRELLSAIFVLDRWREGEKKMVARWFHEFAFPLAENSAAIGDMKMAIRGHDLQRMLFTACGDEMDEAKMQPFVTELLAAMTQRGRSYIAEKTLWDYSDTHPKLLETIKKLCWKRLTDDTRLDFYRDVYLHAKERFIKEDARVRIEKALSIWRTREPRHRFARWKVFVACRKLMRSGDAHFRACSMTKLVRRFRQNRQRKQEMHAMVLTAEKHRNSSLLRFTFRPWTLFWRSMQLIHAAAWKRSERHDVHRRQKRSWSSWSTFHEQAKVRRAYCEKTATAFIACRHQKILRSSIDTWLFHKRRQKDVAAADIRGRQLQQDLWLQEQIEAESAQMEIEDKLSAAVAAKARASAEKGRRRSFIEATDRVHANRKLQKQKEERIQYKANRERTAELEATQAWAAIREQVAAEVRSTTLTWLDTRDAKDQIQTEANRIFETDAKWIRNELNRDAENSAKILPKGCRWQVFLEAPHGIVTRKLTKAFYLNTVTYEKYWCDEVVLEECEGIAREVIVQRRIDEAVARLNEKQKEWDLQRRQNIAATRIQMMFRCRQARLVCRRIIRNTLIKRIDPRSGQIVYFNFNRPQEIRRKPPKLIGSDEPLIPIESTTWVYRQDTHGAGYYERLDTGESSVGPPDHYMLCTRCSVYFVTRRKTSSGARYCIGCYANSRYASRIEASAAEKETEWTKMPVQPANCMICRNTLADFVCTDCKHDATCTRCFNAIHGRLAKNKTHAPPIHLVNRVSVA
ncbi:hypothetical protein PC129_g7180 [Phytophthora cactorum]|uniref:Uncharacterized protein n=1 Tax=Phytophthora cactorum TaxID=29920 RepID=A0A329SBQ3_9STRA|nr:hypothetical protein Pcac1_g21181 [Phytophthora cactorum]KAG2943869.1 hypothetical protein PC115_g603 [Phytophthora cactorum]KAG3222090.1 hypothetical protein PC129_g7180 [Phytophthora cactorum]KAG4250172.1 hypothetical protein PC116_g2198 [Phytophthora cactorum]RAW33012.1 hypothetical protein PC110_g10662 [Phytophthora cactorum]